MAKKVRRRKKVQEKKRTTNWYLIGGIVAIGVIGILALLLSALNGGQTTSSHLGLDTLVQNFCESNEENCIETGSSEALITVVEVSDYGCGHCRNFNLEKADVLKAQYVDTGEVRWVVMPYALRDQANNLPTLPSAVSALCANEQDRFDDYHKKMFELQGTSLFNTQQGFLDTAAALGMDVDAFSSCLEDNNYADIILRNISVAQSAGLRSTPTFFIDGRKVEGNLPRISDFEEIIDRGINLHQ